MVRMTDEKFFYKYQSFEDENGDYNKHVIENLANNQLYFQHPREYNDPFDSLIHYYTESTVKAYIDRLMNESQLTREQSIEHLEELIEEGVFKRKGDLLRGDFYAKDYFPPMPLMCCFSKKNNDILMWSHYAKHHKGVCLIFKSKLIEGIPHLTINYQLLKLHPIIYDKKAPAPINMRDQAEETEQMFKFLSTKSSDWTYESEYRIFLTEKLAKGNLNKFKKEELKGIILGARVGYFSANKIYEIINQHYLSKGIDVKFYKARIIPEEYKVLPVEIDLKEHLPILFRKMKLEEEYKKNHNISDTLERLKRGSNH
ncbi:DUF2971 domain-containing protein [Methanosarcina sp. UBA411]|jgi:hypothetical protein|uniref:DUF2971 domain-containing protein n=1 Tax=Methanosarcina sp. UBA411 TaxID=1915589 RepID=UPI0025FE62C1|nr:DUF2971 domain-containing protein [Methanosarcina sp. UBA411]